MRGVGRVLRRRVGDAGEVLDVDQRGHQRGAVLDHQLDGVVGDAGAVFDAVDARVDQPGQGVLAEHVRGHPGTVGVGGVDRVDSSTSSDHSGARSPMPRSIQSPTSLTQPSPQRACSATACGQLRLVLDVDRRTRGW